MFTSYNHWWVVPVIACHVGGVAGAWAYYLAVEVNWPEDGKNEEEDVQQEKKSDGQSGTGKNYLQVNVYSLKCHLSLSAPISSTPTCTNQPIITNLHPTQAMLSPDPTLQMRRSTNLCRTRQRGRMDSLYRSKKKSAAELRLQSI